MAGPTLLVNLDANIKAFAAKMTTASETARKFSSKLSESYKEAAESLNRHNMGLKDTARIVQGIMVSQAFYSVARTIRESTNALIEFNEQLDYAKVTYSALFGDPQLAENFTKVLQEHSINTIFGYQELADVSKKLLAYGIEYKNLMYVMRGITDLGAMSGDSDALMRVARALGQISTKGTLKAEEMKQLADAYVPIYDIVQSKFNLTADQMGKIGDLKIPAADVINAVVDYANEKFGSVGEAAMYTITGLKNRVVDTFKVMASEMTEPLTEAWKSFLKYVSDELGAIREVYKQGGWDGLLKALVPDPAAQEAIRKFLSNVAEGFRSLLALLKSFGRIAGQAAHMFITAFNIVAPMVNALIAVFSSLLDALTQNTTALYILRTALYAAAAGFVILRAQALGALVITAVSAAITGLSKALLVLSSVMTKPLGLLLVLATAVLGVAVVSNKADYSLSKLFGTIEAAGSTNDEFSESVENVGGALDDVDKKAKKAKKSLLSFDEVFRLQDNDETDTSSITDSLDNLIQGFEGLGDALIPEIPDFSDFAANFMSNLKDSMLAKLGLIGIGALLAKKILDGILASKDISATGKAIASNIGKAIYGGLLGLAWDTIVSPLTDKLWVALEEQLSLAGGSARQASIGSTIGAVIGGSIGALVGGLPGSIVGAMVGQLAGGVVGLFWQEIGGAFNNTVIGGVAGIAKALLPAFTTAMTTSLGSGFTTALASAIKNTSATSIVKGGLIGMAIGFVTDALAAMLWKSLAEKFDLGPDAVSRAKMTQSIGGGLGAVVGAIFGGPVGAMIGSAVGTFAGGLVGLFWEPIKQFTVESAISIAAWAVQTNAAFETWVAETSVKIASWATQVNTDFTNWVTNTNTRFNNWVTETGTGIKTWVAETSVSFAAWVNQTNTDLNTWAANTATRFTSWVSQTDTNFKTWVANTTTRIATWAAQTNTDFETWVANTSVDIASWVSTTSASIGTWAAETLANFGAWIVNSRQAFSEWRANTYSEFSAWFANLVVSVRSWWDNVWDINNWLDGWSYVSSWFSNLWNGIGDWFSNLGSQISSWWNNLWSGLSIPSFVSSAMSFGGGLLGHATGGIFTKEHIARFAEGGKAEAVIPLENAAAMQPFVDLIAGGVTAGLAPVLAGSGGGASSEQLPPVYVGTLIADERGLRELERKMRVIRVQEERRGN